MAYESSHKKCSVKKGVLKNFAEFSGQHLCQSLFFHNVSGSSTFLQKETLAKVFSWEFFEIFKNTFFTKHFRWVLLKLVIAQYLRVVVTNIFRRNCWQMFVQLYWKDGPTQAFSWEYYEIFKNSLFSRIPLVAASIFYLFHIFCCYFTRKKVLETFCKIRETRKISAILHSAPYK